MKIPQMNQSRSGNIIIIDQTVVVKWHNRQKSYYEALGYIFTKNGDEFNCRISDLPKGSHATILVKCGFCNKERVVEYREVIKANHTFCRGCASARDLLGFRFGRMTVIELDKTRSNSGAVQWICKCDCGTIKSVIGNSLVAGHTVSCGCYNRELILSRRGENSPHWNPALTDEDRMVNRNQPENYFWRKSVMERDGYCCQICGDNTSGKLNAHHLYGYTAYPEYRFDVNNGITLCTKHHKKFHKWMRINYQDEACTPSHFQMWVYLE